jgi:hypothetical protein
LPAGLGTTDFYLATPALALAGITGGEVPLVGSTIPTTANLVSARFNIPGSLITGPASQIDISIGGFSVEVSAGSAFLIIPLAAVASSGLASTLTTIGLLSSARSGGELSIGVTVTLYFASA